MGMCMHAWLCARAFVFCTSSIFCQISTYVHLCLLLYRQFTRTTKFLTYVHILLFKIVHLHIYVVILHILSAYSKCIMEVILSTAFGRSIDVQGGKGGELYEAALGVFTEATGQKSSNVLAMLRILLSELFFFFLFLFV